jgi:hypothetical protein
MAPKLSVVVVLYDMQREAPRSLLALSSSYQRAIDPEDYEVIVIENGSRERLDAASVERLGQHFRYHYLPHASPSPAPAANFGLARARGEVVCLMIDGARIATPGLLHHGLLATRLHSKVVVAALGYYLGSDFQRRAVAGGYTAAHEDALLDSIDWPADGYRLFEIGTFDECSIEGWARPIYESNALFMHRSMWDAIGGLDERYDLPGGGLVNADTLERACEVEGSELVVLLGEGTFHQVHGGIATNAPLDTWPERSQPWFEQYARLRGRDWAPPERTAKYVLGSLPEPFLQRLAQAARAESDGTS